MWKIPGRGRPIPFVACWIYLLWEPKVCENTVRATFTSMIQTSCLLSHTSFANPPPHIALLFPYRRRSIRGTTATSSPTQSRWSTSVTTPQTRSAAPQRPNTSPQQTRTCTSTPSPLDTASTRRDPRPSSPKDPELDFWPDWMTPHHDHNHKDHDHHPTLITKDFQKRGEMWMFIFLQYRKQFEDRK